GLAWRCEEGRGLVRMFIRASGSEAEQPNSSNEFATHTDSDGEEIEVKGVVGSTAQSGKAGTRLSGRKYVFQRTNAPVNSGPQGQQLSRRRIVATELLR